MIESVSKLVASGAEPARRVPDLPGILRAADDSDPERWGKPLAALLGAFEAQLALGMAAIGGKDSMSGTFEKLDVPPTLVSFAVTDGKTADVSTGEFKKRWP